MVFPTGLSRRRLLIAGVLAATMQTGILASMIREGTSILAEGTPISLKTVPVDPRDLLRGDYVTLRYEFSTLEASLIEGPWPAMSGDATLYVVLAPSGDGYWHPLRARFQQITPDPGEVVLRSLPFHFELATDRPATISAEYGLERYYVPEGQGKELEQARNASRVVIDARVLDDGTARIAALRLEPEQAGGGS